LLEQAFLDFFKPGLNLDSKATPSRYNAPMKSKTYKQFVKQRSHSIAVFNKTTNQLLWIFESKQQCTTLMGIHHSTLIKCINTNTTYLNSFKFSVISSNNLLLQEEEKEKPDFLKAQNITIFLNLVKQKRKQFESYKYRNKKAQKIYAQHVTNPLLSQVFEQRECAKFLKADRETLRKILNKKKGCFRKVWKLRVV